jgi:Ca2+-transporting ATPase
MKGHPGKPGLWGDLGSGLWSFETGGSRLNEPADMLEPVPGKGDAYHLRTPEGTGPEGEALFTVFQVSLFFSVYVFFQVWNQINCRSLVPEVSGFHRLFSNPTFLVIAGLVAVGQVVIVTFGGAVFKVEPLGAVHWLAVIGGTASVLVFAEVARRLRLATARS